MAAGDTLAKTHSNNKTSSSDKKSSLTARADDDALAEQDLAAKIAGGLVFLHLPGHLVRRLNQSTLSLFIQHAQAAGFDLTPVQWAAICGIRAYPNLDQASLAGLIAHDKATMSGVVDRLVTKGLVARNVSSRDKRMHQLSLTPLGEALFGAMSPVVDEIQQDIMSPLSEDEKVLFSDLLLKMVTAHNDRSRVPMRPVSDDSAPAPAKGAKAARSRPRRRS